MATFTKYQNFVKDLCSGIHDFSTHTVQVAVTADTPIAASDSVYADTSALGDVNGYVSGGYTVAVSLTTSGGSVAIVGTDVSFTASGTVGPFRYAFLFNDTASAGNLIGYWDYGSDVTLATGEIFTVDFGTSMFTVT